MGRWFPKTRPLLRLRDRALARTYQRAPVVAPRVQRSYKALVAEVKQQFQSLPVDVVFTDQDPYGPSSKAMIRDVKENKRLKIWTGSSEHPILTPEENWLFRAVHDYYGHFGGPDQPHYTFTREGEHKAYKRHKSMFSPKAHAALASETEAQQAVFHTTGDFAQQQKAVRVPWVLR